ncbi:uncharacterized protein [Dysidea avara]
MDSRPVCFFKSTHNCSGAYGYNKELPDPYQIKSWFVNPFNPPKLVHWLICPSHQLKNMINALHSSRSGGTKNFLLNGSEFGWQAIIDLYMRECGRIQNRTVRMVPKLREVHVIRDSWIKLNVAPAKLMQQEQVLGELFDYLDQEPHPDDYHSVKNTLRYLEACSKILESGFLSHERVDSTNCKIVTSILEGFNFFSSWHQELLPKDDKDAFNSRNFLAWQS